MFVFRMTSSNERSTGRKYRGRSPKSCRWSIPSIAKIPADIATRKFIVVGSFRPQREGGSAIIENYPTTSSQRQTKGQVQFDDLSPQKKTQGVEHDGETHSRWLSLCDALSHGARRGESNRLSQAGLRRT